MFSELATLQTLLEGVDLPARKADLVRYAGRHDEGGALAHLLDRLPDREYASTDDVAEALAPVQPVGGGSDKLPREESGLPPGGDDYLTADPTAGGVRHDAPPENPPQKAIEQQTKTQNEQQERQKEMLGGG